MQRPFRLPLAALTLLLLTGLAYGVGAQTEEATPTPPAVGRRALQPATPAADGTAEAAPPAITCEIGWFFGPPNDFVEVCPAQVEATGSGTFLQFQYGYMLWTERSGDIWVLLLEGDTPTYAQFDDPYVAGSPERDPAWPEPQPPQTHQPRLGFGEVWRANDDLRARLGWAVTPWETVYTVRTQPGPADSLYIEAPDGGVFALHTDGTWALHRQF